MYINKDKGNTMNKVCALFVCLYVCLLPANAMKKGIDLSNQGLTDLSGIVFKEGVRRIELNGNQITSLDTANFPDSVTSLGLNDNQISEITNLPANLVTLAIENNQLTSINGLPAGMRSFFADDNQITSIAEVANLPELSVLSVNRNQITDISVIQNLNSLEQLQISNNNISDIDFNWPTTIDFLDFSNNQIVDITPLAQITNIRVLRATDGVVAEIPDLSKLNRLQDVSLPGHAITELNCSFLPDSLREIFLLDNDIANVISPCELNMPKLKDLNLGSNNIVEINMTLNRAKKLKKIDLSSNDLTSLANLTIKPRRKNFTLDVRDNGNLPQSEIKAFKKRHPNARVKSGGFF